MVTTFGSLGDLCPYLALGRGLKARGYEAIIATSAGYGERVRGQRLGVRPIRPDLPDPETMRAEMRHVMDEERGSEAVFRRWVMPALRDSLADTMAASEGADLLVSHLLTLATPLAAEMRGFPWVSTARRGTWVWPSFLRSWPGRSPIGRRGQ